MIGVVNNDGVFIESVLFEFFDRLPHKRIHFGYSTRILGVSIPHFGKIRMVGSENHFLGVNGFVLMIAEGSGFMAITDIVYGEKRLAFFPKLPSSSIVLSGIVPEVLGVATTGCSEVVVGFRTIAGEVTGLLHELVVEVDRCRNLESAAHWLGSVGDGVHTRDPRGSGRGTHRSVIKAVEVAEAFFCKLVDMRSLRIFTSVTTDPFDAVVLAGHPKNIGFGHFAMEAKG